MLDRLSKNIAICKTASELKLFQSLQMKGAEMKTTKNIVVLILAIILAWPATWAVAGVRGKITKEIIEMAVETSARQTPRIVNQSAREVATETLKHAVKRHGDGALRLADGGLEFLEIAAKHGDDVLEMGMKATPAARRALTNNVGLLPLARRVGVEALELEAKCPGLSQRIFATFGDDMGRQIAKHVPSEDIPRLFQYAQHADNPATKQALLKQYAKEGSSLFERIPSKLVLSSGLTVAAIYGTHRVTRPFDEVGDQIAENSRLAKHFINLMMIGAAGLATIFGCILLWRFRLMPWYGKKITQPNQKDSPQAKGGVTTDRVESDPARRVPALAHQNVSPQIPD